jgi:putative alpha-1,2-mannosidase
MKLEMQIMNMGQYAHGNQPIQHMIYLYNYAGQPGNAVLGKRSNGPSLQAGRVLW